MKVLEAISPVIAEPIELPAAVGFRNYEEDALNPIQARVRNHYYMQHQFQTVEFVKSRVSPESL